MPRTAGSLCGPNLVAGAFIGKDGPLATGLQVAAFSQVGVLIRVLLGEVLLKEVTSDGVSSAGGAFFKDLPANALGSFVIGLLSTTSSLSELYPAIKTQSERPLAALSPGNPLQAHSAAQVERPKSDSYLSQVLQGLRFCLHGLD